MRTSVFLCARDGHSARGHGDPSGVFSLLDGLPSCFLTLSQRCIHERDLGRFAFAPVFTLLWRKGAMARSRAEQAAPLPWHVGGKGWGLSADPLCLILPAGNTTPCQFAPPPINLSNPVSLFCLCHFVHPIFNTSEKFTTSGVTSTGR